jgi:hypothetical protein
LGEGDRGVIGGDEDSSLRDAEFFPGLAVVDVLGNPCLNIPWQIGIDAGDEDGGDNGAVPEGVPPRKEPVMVWLFPFPVQALPG